MEINNFNFPTFMWGKWKWKLKWKSAIIQLQPQFNQKKRRGQLDVNSWQLYIASRPTLIIHHNSLLFLSCFYLNISYIISEVPSSNAQAQQSGHNYFLLNHSIYDIQFHRKLAKTIWIFTSTMIWI